MRAARAISGSCGSGGRGGSGGNGGSSGSSGRCEPHGQRMGGVGVMGGVVAFDVK